MSYLYRYHCINNTSYKYEERFISEGPPTICNDNPDDPINTDSITIINKPNDTLVFTKQYVDTITGGNAILSGTVTWIQGFEFEVTPITYEINNKFYFTNKTILTLPTSDNLLDKFVTIIVDTNSTVSFISGELSNDPIKPNIPINTLEVVSILIPASSTNPNLIIDNIYINNTGYPYEWNFSESTGDSRIFLSSLSDPLLDTRSIELNNAIDGDYILATYPIDFDIYSTNILEISVKPKGRYATTVNYLSLELYYNDNLVSQPIKITNKKYSYDSYLLNYQTISLPKNDLSLSSNIINKIKIINTSIHGVGYFIDRIRFQQGNKLPSPITHIDDVNNPHNVTKNQIGLGNVQNILNNYTANSPPGINDDTTLGYTIGSLYNDNTTGNTYMCIDNTENNAKWDRINVPEFSVQPATYFDAYNTIGGLINNVYTDLPLNIQRTGGGEYTHNILSNAEVQINNTDIYLIIARVTTSVVEGFSRTNTETKLVYDDGSGYKDIPGSFANNYNREVLEGDDTCTISILLNININTKIKVQTKITSGTNVIMFKPNACSLTILKAKGEKGSPGDQGPAGTGSSINVEYNGSLLPNIPYNTLNFTGTGVNLIDDNSKATIDITAPTPIFGSEFEIFESLSIAHTTINSFISKSGFPVTTLSKKIGKYIIHWSYGWNHDSTLYDFESNITLDGVIKMSHLQEPSESNGTDNPSPGTGTDQMYRASGFFTVDFAVETTHSIDIKYKTTSTGTVSSIWDVRIYIHRVE